MTFEYSDAWLLGAIKLSENWEGASLMDIIQVADYINHAIMTNTEFSTGVKKLIAIGLVIEKDKRLQTTGKFKGWWSTKYGQRSRISLLKSIEEIAKYLNTNFGISEEPTTEIETEITDADFDKATKEYLKSSSATLEKFVKRQKE
jgi:hypothetical protein